MIICYYLTFVAFCWLRIVYDMKNAPTDMELWGHEVKIVPSS
jgi:hypothetical protein